MIFDMSVPCKLLSSDSCSSEVEDLACWTANARLENSGGNTAITHTLGCFNVQLDRFRSCHMTLGSANEATKVSRVQVTDPQSTCFAECLYQCLRNTILTGNLLSTQSRVTHELELKDGGQLHYCFSNNSWASEEFVHWHTCPLLGLPSPLFAREADCWEKAALSKSSQYLDRGVTLPGKVGTWTWSPSHFQYDIWYFESVSLRRQCFQLPQV